MAGSSREPFVFPGLPPWPEQTRLARALRTETVGGLILLVAAGVALVWANSPARDAYEAVRDTSFGFPALGLELSVAHWTADGLLTVFFLVAGIELKRELVAGQLSSVPTAALPVVAALCGMAVPAAVYFATVAVGGGSPDGWAVPMATDIAFALAVLAVLNTHLPTALRAFLLTLAVVDDLGAILVIAVFFSGGLEPAALGGACAGLLLFGLLQRLRVRGWWWYAPLGLVVWGLTYTGGVHATVAGVAMGLLLRARPDPSRGEVRSPGERAEHLLRPFSAGVAVPLFALFAAGVSVAPDVLGDVFTQPETLGVVLGLVVGKTVGVLGGTCLAARFTRARLDPALAWADVGALAVLAGIGFTVALLIGEASFTDPSDTGRVKAAVLAGSLLAAAVAGGLIKRRNVVYRRMWEAEHVDADGDGIPDVYQRGTDVPPQDDDGSGGPRGR
ncbi:Na+/H+ antiporter NhaA [Streptomyces sp. CC53]|uniref:Na+/H+ antiporter NhaA n=1 Tax=unclassified Streptomyces TaxID=2593676 RepID=UPI0008DE4C80|nr:MULTISPECIES: Na+/H+ antiporter NhaA [unclassified Streptomyces]OII62726.1 Na+/H+ antiporter NhaA [Streptomyces sp. CC53]